MAGKGGYQPPRKPSAASGPGSKSQRTDGSQMKAAPDFDDPQQKFGDQQAQLQAQTAVPLSSSSGPGPRQTSSPSAGAGRDLSNQIFGRPSDRPNEALSEGLSLGPGGGPESLQNPPPPEDDAGLVLHYFAVKYGLKGASEAIAARRSPQPDPPYSTGVSGVLSDIGGAASGVGEWLSEPVGPDNPTFGTSDDDLWADDFTEQMDEAELDRKAKEAPVDGWAKAEKKVAKARKPSTRKQQI